MKTSMHFVESLLQSQFELLMLTSLISGIVVAFGLIIQRLFKTRISQSVIGWLWIVVLLRFVLFISVESPLSALNLIPNQSTVAYVGTFVSTTSVDQTNDDGFDAGSLSVESLEPDFSGSNQTFVLFWGLLIIATKLVWVVGAAWFTLKFAIESCSIQRMISGASEPSDSANRLLKRCVTDLGIRRSIQLKVVHDLPSPALAGILCPTILLPEWAEKVLSENQLRIVFMHELVHVRRWDLLIQLFANVVKILHWFNPAAHIVAEQIESCRELACDEQVLKALEADKSTRTSYGQAIIRIAELSSSQSVRYSMLNAFAATDNHLLRKRIDMLIENRKPRRGATVLCLTLIAVLVAVGFTNAQTNSLAQEPQLQSVRPETSEAILHLDLESIVPQQAMPESIVFQKSDPVSVAVGESVFVSFDFDVPEVMVENPDVVKATPVDSKVVSFQGLEAGRMSYVIVRDTDRTPHFILICVTSEASEKEKIVPGGLSNALESDAKKTLKLLSTKTTIAANKSYSMELNTARRFEHQELIREIVVEDPEVAHVTPLSPTEIVIYSAKPGTTRISIKTDKGNEYESTLNVKE